MKIERYVLSALCAGVCVWSATMIGSVIGLARAQGPSALLALLEVAAFLGAGLVPLLLLWSASYNKALVAVWAVCMTYVTLLALNLVRLEFFAKGGIRLALWIVITVLFVRALQQAHKQA